MVAHITSYELMRSHYGLTEVTLSDTDVEGKKELEEIIFTIVHDVINPLRTLSTYIEWVNEDYPDYSSEKLSSIAEKSLVSIGDIRAIASNLDRSKISTDMAYQSLQKTLVWLMSSLEDDVSSLATDTSDVGLRESLEKIQASYESLGDLAYQTLDVGNAPAFELKRGLKSITGILSIDYDPRLNLELKPGFSLAGALSNLAYNALAHGGATSLNVSTRPIDNFIELYFVDDGSGIDPRVAGSLFERGVTTGGNGTVAGTGIGLYSARKTFQEMGGDLTLDLSYDGPGAAFKAQIPQDVVRRYRPSNAPQPISAR